jgi:hypothetical protein
VDLLNKYKQEIEQDLIINDFNIKEVQLRLASRKHFWVARLIDEKINLNKLHKKKKDLKKKLTSKIINEAPVRLTQQTAERAADCTDEIISISDSIKDSEFVIEYLEKVDKIMNNLHWDIKNIIDIQKMEQL